MKRRTFLSVALSTVPVMATNVAAAIDNPGRAVFVPAGTDRFGTPAKFAIGHIDCKVSAQDTNGALSVFEAVTSGADRPARHFHHEQDEWFHILEGEYILEVGAERFHLRAGDAVLAPRKVAHAWACVSAQPGKLVTVFQPAGKMEEFFQQLPAHVGRASREEMQQLYRAHDMEIVGPPLPLD